MPYPFNHALPSIARTPELDAALAAARERRRSLVAARSELADASARTLGVTGISASIR